MVDKDIGMRFCRECANMLYPNEKVDEDTKVCQLIYKCKTCSYIEAVDPTDISAHCVYVNEMKLSKRQETGLNFADYISDPTLMRVKATCGKCGHNEAVIYINEQNIQEMGMRLTYICTGVVEGSFCGYSWT